MAGKESQRIRVRSRSKMAIRAVLREVTASASYRTSAEARLHCQLNRVPPEWLSAIGACVVQAQQTPHDERMRAISSRVSTGPIMGTAHASEVSDWRSARSRTRFTFRPRTPINRSMRKAPTHPVHSSIRSGRPRTSTSCTQGERRRGLGKSPVSRGSRWRSLTSVCAGRTGQAPTTAVDSKSAFARWWSWGCAACSAGCRRSRSR